MLDERKEAILRAIVEEYVATGHPVGSAAVGQKAALAVSSATVRNEMVVLEAQGYISQPHTSAGRIPTDLGYRYYVDHLSAPLRLSGRDRATVSEFFSRAHRELEGMLAASTRLLSQLTAYAAVVVGPPLDTSRILDAHLVRLGPATVLAVVVMSTGRVEKFLIEHGELSEEDVAQASQAVAAAVRAKTPSEAEGATAQPTGNRAADGLATVVVKEVAAWAAEHRIGQLFLGGAANLAQPGAEIEEVQQVLDALERQVAFVSILSDALDQAGLVVRIGSEIPLPEMREWSLVSAPYRAGGRALGTVGVVGPTRMNYARAISAVEAVSAALGAAFGSLGQE